MTILPTPGIWDGWRPADGKRCLLELEPPTPARQRNPKIIIEVRQRKDVLFDSEIATVGPLV